MRSVSMVFVASTVSVFAALGPAESAVEFVKKLETGKVDLAIDADTAIIADISPNKKESIRQRLQRLSEEITGGEIEVGPTRVEGVLAGVILRMVDPADPMEVRVLPLAMVRRGQTWRAAPVPASFENTLAAYSQSSRTNARQLELWLARERVNEVERCRTAAGDLLRLSIANAISPETVRTWSPERAVSEFLDACEKRETLRILALLGGLSNPLPDNWQQLATSVRTAVASPSTGSNTWSLLTSPAVLRISVQERDKEGRIPSFRVLFLDPRNDEKGTITEQTLAIRNDNEGLWKIEVPESETVTIHEDEALEKSADLLTIKYPSRPKSSAEELRKSLIGSFRSSDPPYSCLQFVTRENQSSADLGRFKQAVLTRWETMNPASPVIPIEMDFHQEADRAYLAMQWLSLGKLVYTPRIFHLQKNSDGWVWNTSPDKTANISADKWVKNNEAVWKKSFLDLAVRSCPMPDFTLPSPQEMEASALTQEYFKALTSKNWHKALSLCARLGADTSASLLLRNLGYECRSVLLDTTSLSHDILIRGKAVTLVAARSGGESRSIQSLLPVVSTPAGPRILIEIDLGDPSRPGRAFLNRNALARLDSLHPKVAEEMKDMISEHLDTESK
jgi:hypothetical protein